MSVQSVDYYIVLFSLLKSTTHESKNNQRTNARCFPNNFPRGSEVASRSGGFADLLTTYFILARETYTFDGIGAKRATYGEIVANGRDRLRSRERKEIPFYTDSHFTPTRGGDGPRKKLRMLYGEEPTYLPWLWCVCGIVRFLRERSCRDLPKIAVPRSVLLRLSHRPARPYSWLKLIATLRRWLSNELSYSRDAICRALFDPRRSRGSAELTRQINAVDIALLAYRYRDIAALSRRIIRANEETVTSLNRTREIFYKTFITSREKKSHLRVCKAERKSFVWPISRRAFAPCVVLQND